MVRTSDTFTPLGAYEIKNTTKSDQDTYTYAMLVRRSGRPKVKTMAVGQMEAAMRCPHSRARWLRDRNGRQDSYFRGARSITPPSAAGCSLLQPAHMMFIIHSLVRWFPRGDEHRVTTCWRPSSHLPRGNCVRFHPSLDVWGAGGYIWQDIDGRRRSRECSKR